MMKLMLAAAVVALTAVSAADVGDRLIRTFPYYVSMPKTLQEAVSSKWVAVDNAKCHDWFGIGYRYSNDDDESTTLYFTPAGQLSGIAIDVYGAPPSDKVVSMGYYEKVAADHYRMTVIFRDPASICSMTKANEHVVGDRLVVNPHIVNHTLPLTSAEAKKKGFVEGSCTLTMGYHYVYNLDGVSAPVVAETLMPVVPMYNTKGDVHGIRFQSLTVQENSIFDTNHWDPIKISVCTNTCNDACTESSEKWSTYHVFFKPLLESTSCGWCLLTCC